MPEMRTPVGIVRGEPAEARSRPPREHEHERRGRHVSRAPSARRRRRLASRAGCYGQSCVSRTMQARQRVTLRHVEGAADVVVVGAASWPRGRARAAPAPAEARSRRAREGGRVGRHQTAITAASSTPESTTRPGRSRHGSAPRAREHMYRYCDERGIPTSAAARSSSRQLRRAAATRRAPPARQSQTGSRSRARARAPGRARAARRRHQRASRRPRPASSIPAGRAVPRGQVRSAGARFAPARSAWDRRRTATATLSTTTDERLRAGGSRDLRRAPLGPGGRMTGAPASPGSSPSAATTTCCAPRRRTLVNRLIYPSPDPASLPRRPLHEADRGASGSARTPCSPSRARAIASQTCVSPTSGDPRYRASMPSRSATGVWREQWRGAQQAATRQGPAQARARDPRRRPPSRPVRRARPGSLRGRAAAGRLLVRRAGSVTHVETHVPGSDVEPRNRAFIVDRVERSLAA